MRSREDETTPHRRAFFRACVAVLGAVLAVGGLGTAAGAQVTGAAQEPPSGVADDAAAGRARPPADAVFPVPLPYEARFSDDWHACRDGCERRHKGNDVFADEGAPAVAVEAGEIVRVDNSDDGNGGLSLWLLGESGVAYYYAHNSVNLVTEGQRVARGQMIARVGHTGNARTTPSHIHFQMNLCGETSSAEPCTVNPYRYLTTWAQGLMDGGPDGVGWYQPSTGAFGQRTEVGSPLSSFPFGTVGARGVAPVAGDWDGDGRESVGLYQLGDATFRLRDDEGKALAPVAFGEPGRRDVLPVAGDFDGDGRDTVGLYRRADATFVVLVRGGQASRPVALGTPGRRDSFPVVGDWDGDSRDSVGVYHQGDGSIVWLDDDGRALRPTNARRAGPGVLPVAGDWDGDGRDAVGVLRRNGIPAAEMAQLAAAEAAAAEAAAARLAAAAEKASDSDSADDEEVVEAERAAEVAEAVAAAETSRAAEPAEAVEVPAFDLPAPTATDRAARRIIPVDGGADVLPVSGDWNGHDLITLDELRQIYGSVADEPKVVEGLPALNAAMLRAGISTPARKAAFLATIRSESGFRYDAVEAGNPSRYRGRGLIQLTGAGNYRAAGDDLGLNLVENPDLAINGLASAAIAAWYWTVARDINAAADALDMAAVNYAIGFQPSLRRDMLRCGDFLAALRYYTGEPTTPGVNCERTAASRRLGLRPGTSVDGDTGRPGSGGAQRPSGSVSSPADRIPDGWTPPTTGTPAPSGPLLTTPPPTSSTTRPVPPPSTAPPTRPPTTPPTTAPPTTSPPTTAPPTTSPPTTSRPPTTSPPTTASSTAPPAAPSSGPTTTATGSTTTTVGTTTSEPTTTTTTGSTTTSSSSTTTTGSTTTTSVPDSTTTTPSSTASP